MFQKIQSGKRTGKQTAVVMPAQMDHDGELEGWKGELFRCQFKKTTLCRFYAAGKCKSGTVCAFAHSTSELSAPPDLTKTSLCAAWMGGECHKSSKQCQFAHGAQELRMTPLFKVSLPVRSPKSGTGGTMSSGRTTMGGTNGKRGSGRRQGSSMSSMLTAATDLCFARTSASSGLDMHSDLGMDIDYGMQAPSTDSDINENDCDKSFDDHAEFIQERRPLPCSRQEPGTHNPPAQNWIERTSVYLMTAPQSERDFLADLLERAAPTFYED